MGKFSCRVCRTSVPSQVRHDQTIMLGESLHLGLPALGAPPKVVQEEEWGTIADHFIVQLHTVYRAGISWVLGRTGGHNGQYAHPGEGGGNEMDLLD